MNSKQKDVGFGKKGCRVRKEKMGGSENEIRFNPT